MTYENYNYTYETKGGLTDGKNTVSVDFGKVTEAQLVELAKQEIRRKVAIPLRDNDGKLAKKLHEAGEVYEVNVPELIEKERKSGVITTARKMRDDGVPDDEVAAFVLANI